MKTEPDHTAALALFNAGRKEEALASFQTLCGLQPDNSAAHAGMGHVLFALGQAAESAHSLRKALQLQPDVAYLHGDLGVALQAQKKFQSAIAAHRRAIELDPDALDYLFNLGVCLQHQESYDDAVEAYHGVIARRPDHINAFINLAAALGAAGRLDEAIDTFQQALSLRPGDPEIAYRLALALEQTHQLQQSRKVLVNLLKLSPDHTTSSLLLARLERRAGELDAAHHRLQAINITGMTADMTSKVHTETGRVLEQLGKFGAAFDNYASAQAAIHDTQEAVSLRTSGWLAHMASLRQGITANQVAAWSNEPLEDLAPYDPPPVFLIGHPRSGTTLTEQVLSAHRRFTNSNERPVLRTLTERFRQTHGENWISALDTLPDDELLSLRAAYREAVAQQTSSLNDDIRLIDKNPLNLVDMAFVRRVLPEARIIMLLRDPRDVCLSCFTQLFRLNSAMAWFTSLAGTARHYAIVMDLWLHYRSVLGLHVLEIYYEDFVENLEDRTHDIFTFLDEDWDAAVLCHHEQSSRKYISTPSYEGVTTAPYSSSIGRWINFTHQLQPVLPVLQPFVKSFGY